MTEIRVKIPLEGISTGESEMSVHAVSTLYDLWQDHVHYRTQAELTRQNGTELEFAREIRSSILAFFSYFDGVLNLWINKIDPNVPLHQTGFTSKLRLIREHIDDRTKCRFLDLGSARNVRNSLSHPTPGQSEFNVSQYVKSGDFLDDSQEMEKWLKNASSALGWECHADVPGLLKKLSQ